MPAGLLGVSMCVIAWQSDWLCGWLLLPGKYSITVVESTVWNYGEVKKWERMCCFPLHPLYATWSFSWSEDSLPISKNMNKNSHSFFFSPMLQSKWICVNVQDVTAFGYVENFVDSLLLMVPTVYLYWSITGSLVQSPGQMNLGISYLAESGLVVGRIEAILELI